MSRQETDQADAAAPAKSSQGDIRAAIGAAAGGGAGLSPVRLAWGVLAAMFAVTAFTGAAPSWFVQAPSEPLVPLNAVLNAAMDAFISWFRWFFRAVAFLLEQPDRKSVV